MKQVTGYQRNQKRLRAEMSPEALERIRAWKNGLPARVGGKCSVRGVNWCRIGARVYVAWKDIADAGHESVQVEFDPRGRVARARMFPRSSNAVAFGVAVIEDACHAMESLIPQAWQGVPLEVWWAAGASERAKGYDPNQEHEVILVGT